MELRYLRCFFAVAEELYLARAAEPLYIEQSPLSRVIAYSPKALADFHFSVLKRAQVAKESVGRRLD